MPVRIVGTERRAVYGMAESEEGTICTSHVEWNNRHELGVIPAAIAGLIRILPGRLSCQTPIGHESKLGRSPEKRCRALYAGDGMIAGLD
jgi:hypothetical protein